jgi:hypothetical protein
MSVSPPNVTQTPQWGQIANAFRTALKRSHTG